MAFYVQLRKLNETDARAEYSFAPDDQRIGKVVVRKDTGDVELLEAISGNDAEPVYLRAAAKLRSEWRRGVMPDLTAFAS